MSVGEVERCRLSVLSCDVDAYLPGGWEAPRVDDNADMADHNTYERRLRIAAPAGQILPHLVDFRRWVDWSPWEGLDPALSRTYAGPNSGVGASCEWSGNRKAGAGSMRITDVTPESVAIDLRFTRPFKSTSAVRFTLIPQDAATEVIWSMRSPRTLGTRVFGVIMNMDKAIGGDLDNGLATLKVVVEGTQG